MDRVRDAGMAMDRVHLQRMQPSCQHEEAQQATPSDRSI